MNVLQQTPPGPPPSLRRLRPPAPRTVPLVVRRADLPASAWAGLHLDGVLVPLWRDTSRVTGAVESPAVRAAAFTLLVPARGAVGRLAAAWVHTGGAPPRRTTVLVRSGVRRPDPHPHRTVAEADLDDDDLQPLGGVLVTTPLRTALDVARWVPAPQALPALRALRDGGADVDEARRRVDTATGGRGVRRARHTLRLL